MKTKKESHENKIVTHSSHRHTEHSLYHVINNYHIELCGRGYEIEHSRDSSPARWYIRIPNESTNLIFKSNIEAHLTVDKDYKKNTKGLSPSHFTDVYQNEENGQTVVHAYFDLEGKFNGLFQIKGYDRSGNLKSEMSINAEVEATIRKRARHYQVILADLISFKKKKYADSIEHSFNLNYELTSMLSEKTPTSEKLAFIKSKASEYKEAVQNAGLYDGNKDGRENFFPMLDLQIELYQKSLVISSEKSAPIVEKELITDVDSDKKSDLTRFSDPSIKTTPKTPSLFEEIDGLELSEFGVLLNKKYEHLLHLEQQLLAQELQNTSPQTPKYRRKLRKIMVQQSEVLKNYLLSGDLVSVEPLFEEMSPYIQLNQIYIQLLEKMQTCKSEDREKYYEILNYLYSHSTLYRCVFDFYKSIVVTINAEEAKYAYGLLSLAIYTLNKPLLKLCLEQGLSPNENGQFVADGATYKAIYLLIWMYPTKTNESEKRVLLSFLQLMVEYGLSLEHSPGKVSSCSLSEEQQQTIKSLEIDVDITIDMSQLCLSAKTSNTFNNYLAPGLILSMRCNDSLCMQTLLTAANESDFETLCYELARTLLTNDFRELYVTVRNNIGQIGIFDNDTHLAQSIVMAPVLESAPSIWCAYFRVTPSDLKVENRLSLAQMLMNALSNISKGLSSGARYSIQQTFLKDAESINRVTTLQNATKRSLIKIALMAGFFAGAYNECPNFDDHLNMFTLQVKHLLFLKNKKEIDAYGQQLIINIDLYVSFLPVAHQEKFKKEVIFDIYQRIKNPTNATMYPKKTSGIVSQQASEEKVMPILYTK